MSQEEEYDKLCGEIEFLKRERRENPDCEKLTEEIREKEQRIFQIVKSQSRMLRKFLDLYSEDHFKHEDYE
jgi:hypothetical protein